MSMFERLKSLAIGITDEIKVLQRVLRDSRTPKAAKCFLGFAVGYLLLPLDIIPDFVSVIGHLDDLIVL